jgi:hypothetical protein
MDVGDARVISNSHTGDASGEAGEWQQPRMKEKVLENYNERLDHESPAGRNNGAVS